MAFVTKLMASVLIAPASGRELEAAQVAAVQRATRGRRCGRALAPNYRRPVDHLYLHAPDDDGCSLGRFGFPLPGAPV
jgi:hypothetical protein